LVRLVLRSVLAGAVGPREVVRQRGKSTGRSE
jgi:hypothetical protein